MIDPLTLQLYTPRLCNYCGMLHTGLCSKVKKIEYHENGTVKIVEFFDIYTKKESNGQNLS
jgi:hypothetical protein